MLDIQKDLRKRLKAAFPDVPVHIRVPKSMPKRLITLTREGGRRQDALVDAPGVGILCWAETEQDAWELADSTADLMAMLPFSEGYADVYMEAMYSAPDPDTKKPRWRLSYTIKTYEPKG